jgi:hypothetical protein
MGQDLRMTFRLSILFFYFFESISVAPQVQTELHEASVIIITALLNDEASNQLILSYLEPLGEQLTELQTSLTTPVILYHVLRKKKSQI